MVFAGLGPLLFPLSLVLINVRTRTHEGAVALSGFVQGVGYTLGALGPLVVGVLHQVTGQWTLALVVLLATAAAAAVAGLDRRPPAPARRRLPRPLSAHVSADSSTSTGSSRYEVFLAGRTLCSTVRVGATGVG